MRWAGAAAAVGSIFLLLFQISTHVRFPAVIEMMEATVLQHVERAASGQPIYTEPSREFVALAYNPGFYYASLPVTWLFGVSLAALRLQAILALLCTGVMMFLVVRDQTRDRSWALAAVGLFAAGYKAMDAYLDSAHSDSSMLFCGLAGSWLVARRKVIAGMIMLTCAFWFKQQGVWFVIGAIVFERSLAAAAVPVLLGAIPYVFAGKALFGSHFHYHTWEVPRAWIDPAGASPAELLRILAGACLPLLVPAVWRLWRTIGRPSIWHAQLAAAAMIALAGMLDSGSSNNVYAPLVTLLILFAVFGLASMARFDFALSTAVLILSFLAMANNPRDLTLPNEADSNYAEFLTYSKSLGGTVWSPKFGQLPEKPFAYGAHWVAVYDLIRGPGRDERAHPITQRLLTPRPDFIIMHNELEPDPVLGFLAGEYRLHEDLGERFRPLGNVPHRFGIVWPRLVYKRTVR